MKSAGTQKYNSNISYDKMGSISEWSATDHRKKATQKSQKKESRNGQVPAIHPDQHYASANFSSQTTLALMD